MASSMARGVFGQPQEVQHQRVLGNLPRQVSALPGQPGLEVVRGRTEAGEDVVFQYGHRPTMLDGS
ncbi:hypothetical protein AB4089_17035 [Arthrobacter sp. 2MCAF15]|uniref:hypothetical protein n=1 Tax=Arthrobacter sp. 2MCAF15 TaxID=3232984 RepID=UPI003F8DD4B4